MNFKIQFNLKLFSLSNYNDVILNDFFIDILRYF